MSTARVHLPLGLCASLLLHALTYALLHWSVTLPDVGFQIELPAQVDFGVAEGTHAPTGLATPLPAPAATMDAKSDAPVVPAPKPKPKPKKKPPALAPDAGAADQRVDAGVDAGRLPSPDAGALAAPTTAAQDAGTKSGGHADAGAPALAAYAPPGAQLALRVDMDRVRASALAQDVRALLAAIPDFAMILDGSSIDPIDQLARLFVASPNLERSHLLMAGSYIGGPELPRRAVESLAKAKGKTAKWRSLQGIAVAPWENADETERVLALIGPQLFAITRPDDLPRILGVAHALAARKSKATKIAPQDETAAATDALLAMEDGELVAFSVENAPSFVRGQPEHIPDRIRISIRILPDDVIEVRTEGSYASAATAAAALGFWQGVRDQFAHHPLVALVGMSEPLQELTLQVDNDRLLGRTTLSMDQARRILDFVRGALAPPPTAPAGAARPSLQKAGPKP